MTTLMSLLVKLSVDTGEFAKGLANAEKSVVASTKKMSDNLKGIGQTMTKIGTVATIGLTTPIVAMGVASVKAASDLNESINKSAVVFGDFNDQIMHFSETSATSLGMSQQAALEAMGTFGNLFVSMGLGKDKSAEMSTGLTQLAADLGSFNNLDPTEVFEKLRSGMVGETEPLRALGINLSDITVKQKALEMGLYSGKGALDTQSAALARYQLIMDMSKTAQGDFARTSDGLANSSRILKAEMTDLAAKFGQELMPVAIDLMKAILPIVQGFNNMDPAAKKVVIGVLAVIAIAGPLIGALGTVITTVGSLIGFFGAGGAGASALAAVMSFLSTTVLPAAAAALGAISLPVIALIAAIGLLVFVIIKFGKDAMNTLSMIAAIARHYLGELVMGNINALVGAIKAIGSAISSVINWIGQLASSFLSLQIPDWLKPGSPPPLAYAIDDIGKSMSKLRSSGIPKFSAEFSAAGNAMPNTGMASSGSDSGQMTDLLQEISGKSLNTDRLARVIRDAILQAKG